MFLIEHMDLVWLSVTQRFLINVYCISILAKKKKREREKVKLEEEEYLGKLKNTI